jgi:hypothetical protein
VDDYDFEARASSFEFRVVSGSLGLADRTPETSILLTTTQCKKGKRLQSLYTVVATGHEEIAKYGLPTLPFGIMGYYD